MNQIIFRNDTRSIRCGGLCIGGGAPVTVQSMTNTPTGDILRTVAQLQALEAAGCDIARLAVCSPEDAAAIPAYKEACALPLVADIQYDARLAVAAMQQGIDKVRINPGNIGSDAKVREVVACASERGIPLRVGVNGGSLPKDILERCGGPTPEGLVEAALRQLALLEKLEFYDVAVSLKASTVSLCVRAYQLMAERAPQYPLHLGITEAGQGESAVIKSAAGIGALLLAGIGDTLRVSLTGDPVREVAVGIALLEAVGLRTPWVEIVSCPTCSRCAHDLEGMVLRVRKRLADKRPSRPVKIAVMGCCVNGPGEAKEADAGIACGDRKGVLFVKDCAPRTLPMTGILDALEAVLETL